jgi:hypothetical protein
MLGGGGFGVKEEGKRSILEEVLNRNRELNFENASRLQVLEAERHKNAAMERMKKKEEEQNAYIFLFFLPNSLGYDWLDI